LRSALLFNITSSAQYFLSASSSIHLTNNMKTAYTLLTLLSVALVTAGPIPTNRNDELVKPLEAAAGSALTSAIA
jgi:hypothetical protein